VHVFRLAHAACIIQPVVVDRDMQHGHAIGFHPRQCCRYGPAHVGLRHLAGLDLGAGGCMNRLAPRPGQVDVHLAASVAPGHPLSLFDGDADRTLCLAHIDHMAPTHPARAAMPAADDGHARHALVDRAALATGQPHRSGNRFSWNRYPVRQYVMATKRLRHRWRTPRQETGLLSCLLTHTHHRSHPPAPRQLINAGCPVQRVREATFSCHRPRHRPQTAPALLPPAASGRFPECLKQAPGGARSDQPAAPVRPRRPFQEARPVVRLQSAMSSGDYRPGPQP
jgi:hypothetical protein